MRGPGSAADDLLDLLGGKCRAQALSTVAALGVADRLASGPRTVAALAAELGCDAAALAPLLRLVAGLGFFHSPTPGTYGLTARGAALRSEALGPLAAFVGAPEQWDPWSRLRQAARGGTVAFVETHGVGLYDYLARHSEAAARYDAAIDSFTRHEAAALCAQFDFAGVAHVVDVGGGRGTMLAELLRRWPGLRGTLFDLPHVVERARATLSSQLGPRIEVVGGDFFVDALPAADAYLLKHVLHNWDDARALALLEQCARSLPAHGQLLVVEAILAADERADMAAMLDIEMLVLTGGRERRRPELRRLLQTAGYRIERMAPLTRHTWLLICGHSGVRLHSAHIAPGSP